MGYRKIHKGVEPDECGSLDKAQRIFDNMESKSIISCTTMAVGYARLGLLDAAGKLFDEMPEKDVVLECYNWSCHGGLVEEGRKYFTQMTSKFGLSPQLEHYSCMLDLLGKAGLLDEAEELVKNMAIEPDAVVWGALFFAWKFFNGRKRCFNTSRTGTS
ncbi:hypothetical protein REPUB_Repub11eG0093700 [Reevesia pubescens]